ncbi:hypothetical protein SNEBB_011357 [Seison nebaliae]|nr:hypothetical protein SNEBB_011357 [Seison nebaliae]
MSKIVNYSHNPYNLKCYRCNGIAHLYERVGPVRNEIYHPNCFTCCKCKKKLTLVTVATNSENSEDKLLYCKKHVPQSSIPHYQKLNGQPQNLEHHDRTYPIVPRNFEENFHFEDPLYVEEYNKKKKQMEKPLAALDMKKGKRDSSHYKPKIDLPPNILSIDYDERIRKVADLSSDMTKETDEQLDSSRENWKLEKKTYTSFDEVYDPVEGAKETIDNPNKMEDMPNVYTYEEHEIETEQRTVVDNKTSSNVQENIEEINTSYNSDIFQSYGDKFGFNDHTESDKIIGFHTSQTDLQVNYNNRPSGGIYDHVERTTSREPVARNVIDSMLKNRIVKPSETSSINDYNRVQKTDYGKFSEVSEVIVVNERSDYNTKYDYEERPSSSEWSRYPVGVPHDNLDSTKVGQGADFNISPDRSNKEYYDTPTTYRPISQYDDVNRQELPNLSRNLIGSNERLTSEKTDFSYDSSDGSSSEEDSSDVDTSEENSKIRKKVSGTHKVPKKSLDPSGNTRHSQHVIPVHERTSVTNLGMGITELPMDDTNKIIIIEPHILNEKDEMNRRKNLLDIATTNLESVKLLKMLEAKMKVEETSAVQEFETRLSEIARDVAEIKKEDRKIGKQERDEKYVTLRKQKVNEEVQKMQKTTADRVDKYTEEILDIYEDNDINNEPVVNVSWKREMNKNELLEKYAERFAYVDGMVLQVANKMHESYVDLVSDLTEGCLDDLEKVRAIFRWMTIKNLNIVDFSSKDVDSILKRIKYGLETYHTFFRRLCSFAGIKCVEVKGYSKFVDYIAGKRIRPGEFQNTWNAVYAVNQWHLISCDWAARYLSRKLERLTTKSVTYRYDEHYFCTDPEKFIYEFFPEDQKWQLLKMPIKLHEFIQLPVVHSLFFHYGFELIHPQSSVVSCGEESNCSIVLQLRKSFAKDVQINYILRERNVENTVKITKEELRRFVMFTRDTQKLNFNIDCFKRGIYIFQVYAAYIGSDENLSILPKTSTWICEFSVDCKYKNKSISKEFVMLPKMDVPVWGWCSSKHNLRCISHYQPMILIHWTEYAIYFKADAPGIRKVSSTISSNSDTVAGVTLRQVEDLIEAQLYCSSPGEYAFCLNIIDANNERETIQYLINYTPHIDLHNESFITNKQYLLPYSHDRSNIYSFYPSVAIIMKVVKNIRYTAKVWHEGEFTTATLNVQGKKLIADLFLVGEGDHYFMVFSNDEVMAKYIIHCIKKEKPKTNDSLTN